MKQTCLKFKCIITYQLLMFLIFFFYHSVVAINNCILNEKQFVWAIVSRRSRNRHGPRLIKRGIDQAGNVANFVETEMIVEYNNARSSYVQVLMQCYFNYKYLLRINFIL